MKTTAAIKAFINAQINKHPQIHPWLSDWSPDHETQIQIDTNGLEPCFATPEAKSPTHWEDDDHYEYRNIRIPYGAMTPNPSFYDRELLGPVHTRWQYLGTSGWNWRLKKSMWVGFDFDSIVNHIEGLSAAQLQEALNRAKELNYVVARTSKSGEGFHLLVPLNPHPTTRTHTEHKQLANHVLSRMSKDCDFDFETAADVGGGILWHWERGLRENGLGIIN